MEEGRDDWATAPVAAPELASGRPRYDIPSGFFTGPWTVTRSSLRVLRRANAFCRPLRPVPVAVLFPRSRSPVVGGLGDVLVGAGVVLRLLLPTPLRVQVVRPAPILPKLSSEPSTPKTRLSSLSTAFRAAVLHLRGTGNTRDCSVGGGAQGHQGTRGSHQHGTLDGQACAWRAWGGSGGGGGLGQKWLKKFVL